MRIEADSQHKIRFCCIDKELGLATSGQICYTWLKEPSRRQKDRFFARNIGISFVSSRVACAMWLLFFYL